MTSRNDVLTAWNAAVEKHGVDTATKIAAALATETPNEGEQHFRGVPESRWDELVAALNGSAAPRARHPRTFAEAHAELSARAWQKWNKEFVKRPGA